MGWAAEIKNIPTGKKFVVSTIDARFAGSPVWQAAVFKKRIGPLSAWFKPVLLYGETEKSLGNVLHERIKALVEKVPPKDWEAVKRKWLAESSEKFAMETATEHEQFMDELLRELGHQPTNESSKGK